jgi:uncharacterized protein YoxC
MKVIIDISIIVVLIGVLSLIIYCIPVIVQINRTARKLEDFISYLENELTPITHNLKETLENTNKATIKTLESIEKMKNVIEVIENVGITAKTATSLVNRKITPLMIQIAAITTGINKGIKVFFKGLKKGGDK